MLRPIPASLLTSTAVFIVCTGMTQWQQPITRRVTVDKVHLQHTNSIRRTPQNTETVQNAVLFVDGKPGLDLVALMEESEQAGRAMTCTVTGPYGGTYTYTVIGVDALPDVPSTRVHHWEVALV